MMSPILPPVSMNIAMIRQYRVMTAWIVVTLVSKSSTSWLIETFMTDWSSTITNWAIARPTNGNHDLRVPLSLVDGSTASFVIWVPVVGRRCSGSPCPGDPPGRTAT